VQIESLGASSDIDLWASGEHVGSLPARLEAVPGALAVMAPGPTTRAPAT
jgi:hypothetical protein